MSYRRRSATPKQSRQATALYERVPSSFDGEEENAAPEFIRVPVEQAIEQAARPPRGRRASTPGKRTQNDLPAQTPRGRRASTPGKRFYLPPTPPREEEEDELPPPSSPTPRTPAVARRPGRPRGSVTPKSSPQKLFEDGRGSPKERRRKSELAKRIPRRADGKFAPSNNKNYDDEAEEYQSDGYRSEEEESSNAQSGNDSFRGRYNKNNKKKSPAAAAAATPAKRRQSLKGATPRAQRPLTPVKESFGEKASPAASKGKGKAVASRSQQQQQERRVINVDLDQKKDGNASSSSSQSGDTIQSGDSFDGITEYHKTINNTCNVVVISDSSIGSQRSSSDDEE